MSLDTGVKPALSIALSKPPVLKSNAVEILSDILEGPVTASQDIHGATMDGHNSVEIGSETISERISPVQQTETIQNAHKRFRMTCTTEWDSVTKRCRCQSPFFEKNADCKRTVRERSRLQTARRGNYRRNRRSMPERLRQTSLKTEDLLDNKYPLQQPPSGLNSSLNLPEPDSPISSSTMQTIIDFKPCETLTQDYPKAPTALACDGGALTLFFSNKYIFSNHYRCKMVINGAFFICAEQYYMYQKARYFGDIEIAKLILAAKNPKEMKRLGRRVAGFEKSSWDAVSVQIMKTALYHKFVQNENLRRELFNTLGTTLVEASPMDKYWGVGLSINNDTIRDPSHWKGQNVLGHLLTALREHLMIRPEFIEEVKVIQDQMRASCGPIC